MHPSRRYQRSAICNLRLETRCSTAVWNRAVLCKTWLPGTENQRSVLCNIGLDSEGPTSAVQQLLSLFGMNRPDTEGRLTESSSRTARSPTDRTSARTACRSSDNHSPPCVDNPPFRGSLPRMAAFLFEELTLCAKCGPSLLR